MKWNGYWKRLSSFLLAAVMVLSLVPMPVHVHAASEEHGAEALSEGTDTKLYYLDFGGLNVAVAALDEGWGVLSCENLGNGLYRVDAATKKFRITPAGYPASSELYVRTDADSCHVSSTTWYCQHLNGYVDDACGTCGKVRERTIYMDLSAYDPDSYGVPLVRFYDENKHELNYECSTEGNFDVCVVAVTVKYYTIEKGHAGGGDESGDYPEVPANVDTYIHPTGWSCMHRAGFVDNVCTTCGGEKVATVDDVIYCDFDAAVTDWKDGGTLTLLKDVTTSKSISLGVEGADWVSDAEWVLDLNGKTLDLGNVKSLVTYGDLTVQNGTLRAIVIVDEYAGAFVLDDVQLLNSRNGNNALLVYGTPIVSIINSSLIGGVLYTESLVEAYGDVQFDSTYGLYMVGNGAVRFHQAPTAVLPLKVQTPTEGKAYVMAGTDVTLTADQFTSTVTGYKTTVLADGSIGLTVCDHPESEKGYVYLDEDTHKTVCSLCHFESNNTEAAPHTISNGVCTACGGRQIFVDASYFSSIINEMLYYYVGGVIKGADVKKDDAGYYTTVIPAETGNVYWLHGMKYAECKSEETQLPADKNCMRITGHDSDTGLFTVIWYNHPHEHNYSSETGCCTVCLLPCTHSSWGGDAVCDSCGYTCTHSMHSQYGGRCQTCGLTAEHTFDAFGNCTGQICGAACSHPSLDAQGLCPDCGMRKIYLMGVEYYVDVMRIRHDTPDYYYKNMTKESTGVFSGFMPVGVEGMYFKSDDWDMDYTDQSSERFTYDGTCNAFRVIGETADGYAALHPFNYPCTHTYSDDSGICDLCLEPCAHGSWNADGDVCAICGYTCLHDQGHSDGKCDNCGKACEHAQYAHGTCTTCGTDCAEHQLDAQGFCTVCDMREIYVATKNWDCCTADYNAYSKSRSDALEPVENAAGLYRGMISDQASNLRFIAGGGSMDIMTDFTTLPEDTSLNCFYVTGPYASDEYVVYCSGIWGPYPCVHDWQDGTCTVCQEVCYHLEYDGPGDAYACTNCGYICPHADWDSHFMMCEKCSYKCEAHDGHSFDAMGACTVCNLRQFYVDTTRFYMGAGWEELDADIGGALLSVTTVEPGIFLITTVDNATHYTFKNGSGAEAATYTNVYDPIPQNANCLRILTEGIYDEDSGASAGCRNEWYVYCKHLSHTEEGCPICGDSSSAIHKDVYTVSEDGATVTISCGIETCGAVLDTCTIQAPAHTVYGDGKDPRITFVTGDGTTGFVAEEWAVYYELQNGEWVKLNAAPTDAGTYRAEAINVGAADTEDDDFVCWVQYTVAKANAELTAPVGATGLVYRGPNGDAFSLLASEAASNVGTVMYRVNDGEWVTNLAAAKWNAGTYFVWYKVLADQNTDGVPEEMITVTVAPADFDDISKEFYLIDASSIVYDGTEQEPSVYAEACPHVPAGGSFFFDAVVLVEGVDYTVIYDNNRYPGTATAFVYGMGNYTGVCELTFEIAEAELRGVSVVQDGELTYTGKGQQASVVAEATTCGNEQVFFTYSTSEYGFYGDMPAFANVGTYTVYYEANAEFHKTVYGSFEVTIGKAENEWVFAPNVYNWTYGSSPSVMGALAKFGDWSITRYSGLANDGSAWDSSEVPTKAGSYTAHFFVAGTDNYESLEGSADFTIRTANTKILTAPAARILTYVGDDYQMELVTAGTAEGGTIVYSLEENGTYSTEIPKAALAGEYTVWYYVQTENGNYHDSIKQFIPVTVDKAVPNYSHFNVTLPENAVYDGTAKAVTVEGNNSALGEISVNYYQNGVLLDGAPVDAGTYTFTVSVEESDNFKAVSELENARWTFTIEEAEVTILSISSDSMYYTGEPQSPNLTVSAETVNGQPMTMTFSANQDGPFTAEVPAFTEAGGYYVFFHISAPNHWDYLGYANVTIHAADNSWVTTPSIEGWTYGETASAPVAEAAFGSVAVTYAGTANDGTAWNSTEAPAKAGTYTATFTVREHPNYSGLTETVEFVIEKAVCDLSSVAWTYTDAFVYDGLNHTVAIDEATLPEGAFVSTYTGHTASEVGAYQAAAAIEYDDNHAGKSTLILEWEIVNEWIPTEFTVTEANEYGWYNEDVIITAADGYQISLTDTAEGTWADSLSADVEGEDSSITFYLKNKETGAISLAGELVYDLDLTAPTGTASLNGRTATDSLQEDVAIDLFANEEIEALLDAADENSGIAAIEYAVSEAVLTAEEVMNIEAWTAYEDAFGIEVEDGKQFVVYVRITDKAGNVTYLCSEGAEYDTTAPVIAGIADGMTYYTTKNVTVSDKNLDTVTLNGEEAETAFSLKGNGEAEYVIVAVDKAGNETVITVKTAPISQMAEVLEDLTEENVTSDDLEELEELADAADELLQDADLTEEEKAALEAVEEKAEALMEAIGDAQSAVDTEAIDKTLDITEENVKLSDKADLEGAKEDLGKALENYGDNYTEEEKDAIKEQLQQIEEALTSIENVETTEAALKALPDKVAPDELDQAEKILAAKAAYDALSAYEKSLISDDAKENLDSLVASLTDYAIISGDGSVWTVGSDGTITIVSNGAFSKFIGVKINGTLIDAANYDAKSGSTIITLKTSYLKTLDKGEHTMTILFTDGEVSAIFKIAQATETPPAGDSTTPTTPPTGDNTMVVLWTVTMLISSGAVFVLLLDWKKRFHNTK